MLSLSTAFTIGSSLQHCQIFLNNYHKILLNHTMALLDQYHEHHTCLLLILVMHLVGGAQVFSIIFH